MHNERRMRYAGREQHSNLAATLLRRLVGPINQATHVIYSYLARFYRCQNEMIGMSARCNQCATATLPTRGGGLRLITKQEPG